jgi:hypothetical protein
MTAYRQKTMSYTVDNIDDEVYYDKLVGCSTELSGSCATVTCPGGDTLYRVCEEPQKITRPNQFFTGPEC